MKENNSHLKKNFPEKLVKHLLLNRVSSAILTSKTPLQQGLPYHINTPNS